jgi:hypothetical protein
MIGVRRYKDCRGGEEVLNPQSRIPGKQAKIYRKSIPREDLFELQIFAEPLIPPTLFHALQKSILDRHNKFTTSMRRPKHFLALRVAYCQCGQPLYSKTGSSRQGGAKKDRYYCASRFKGTNCGATGIRRAALDEAIETMVAKYVLNPAYLEKAYRLVKETREEPNGDAAKRQVRLRELDEARARLIELRTLGQITLDEYRNGADKLEQKKKTLLAVLPQRTVLPRGQEAKRMLEAVIKAFARFHRLEFDDKVGLLRRALGQITISGHTIVSVTIRGGFLMDMAGGSKLIHAQNRNVRTYAQG